MKIRDTLLCVALKFPENSGLSMNALNCHTEFGGLHNTIFLLRFECTISEFQSAWSKKHLCKICKAVPQVDFYTI